MIKAYQANTEIVAKHICKCLHYKGHKWADGTSYLDNTNWDKHKESTVYLTNGKVVDIDWCIKSNIPLLCFWDIKITTHDYILYYMKQINFLLFLISIFSLWLCFFYVIFSDVVIDNETIFVFLLLSFINNLNNKQ